MKSVYKILDNQDKVTMKYFYHIRCDPDLDRCFCDMWRIHCACTGCVEKLSNPWLPSLGKPLQPRYAIEPETCKYSSILRGYRKSIFPKLTFFKETTNLDKMEIKDELVLNGKTWSASDNIEYNTIGAFQTSNSNTPGYYIVWWTGNAYTLQEKYTCHEFDPPVIIPEGELVCPSKFMTPMRKFSIGFTIQMRQFLSCWS